MFISLPYQTHLFYILYLIILTDLSLLPIVSASSRSTVLYSLVCGKGWGSGECLHVFLCELMFLGTLSLHLYRNSFRPGLRLHSSRNDLHLLPPPDYTNILGALLLKFSTFNFSDTGDTNALKKAHGCQVVGTNSRILEWDFLPLFLRINIKSNVLLSSLAHQFIFHSPLNWR